MPYNLPPSAASVLGANLLGIGQDIRADRRRKQEIDQARRDQMRQFALEHEGGEGAAPMTERTIGSVGALPTFEPPSFGDAPDRTTSPLIKSETPPPMFRGRGFGMASAADAPPPIPKMSSMPEAAGVMAPARVSEPDARYSSAEVGGQKFYFKSGSEMSEEADQRTLTRQVAEEQRRIDAAHREQDRIGGIVSKLSARAQGGDKSAMDELLALGPEYAQGYKALHPTAQGQIVQMKRPGDAVPGMYALDPDTGSIISRMGDAPKDPYQAQEDAAQRAEIRLRAQRAAALIAAVQKVQTEALPTNADPDDHRANQNERVRHAIGASEFGSLDAAQQAIRDAMKMEEPGAPGTPAAPGAAPAAPSLAPPADADEEPDPMTPPPLSQAPAAAPRAPAAGGFVGEITPAATPVGVDAGHARAIAAELSGMGEGDVDAALDQANVSRGERAYIKALLAGG